MRELCLKHPICAILRNVPLEETEDYARAVLRAGLKCLRWRLILMMRFHRSFC